MSKILWFTFHIGLQRISIYKIFDRFNFKKYKDFHCCKMFTSKQTLAFICDVNWLKGANEHCNNQINTQNCI